MRTYEHREINASGKFEAWYVSEDCTKKVGRDKPDYLQWLKDGNRPEVLPYVAPPAKTLAQLKIEAAAKAEAIKRMEHEKLQWESSQQKKDLDSMKVEIEKLDAAKLETFIATGVLPK